MSFYEKQHLKARSQGTGVLFSLASIITQAYTIAYSRQRNFHHLNTLDERLLKDVGLEKGPDGVFRKKNAHGE